MPLPSPEMFGEWKNWARRLIFNLEQSDTERKAKESRVDVVKSGNPLPAPTKKELGRILVHERAGTGGSDKVVICIWDVPTGNYIWGALLN